MWSTYDTRSSSILGSDYLTKRQLAYEQIRIYKVVSLLR